MPRPVIRRRHRAVAVSVLALAAALIVPTLATTGASAVTTDGPFTLKWSHSMTPGKPVWFGSPGVADLDGHGLDVIVGDVAGKVHAFNASTGASVRGFPYSIKGAVKVMSTPSTTGSGSMASIYLGIGSSNAPTKGGYLALTSSGTKKWYRQPSLLPGGKGGTRGVMSSLSVGDIHTGSDVIGGSMGQMQDAIQTRTGKVISGFPWLQADTNFSTPALADYRNVGKDYIIEGGDSTAGRSYSQTYKNGGHIRILHASGNAGKSAPNAGLVCQANTNQVVQSSPAVGNFLANGKFGVVVGTGGYYKNASDTNRIIAINSSCKRIWSNVLDGSSLPSPALADVDGNGSLDVVTISGKGTVYAFKGTNGALIWKKTLAHGTDGAVTTFTSPDGPWQDILAPTGQGVYLLDGRTGAQIQKISDFRLRSSATVTRDASGEIGITIAGAKGDSTGIIEHYVYTGSNVSTVQDAGAWPMFHHDPQLTGYSAFGRY